MKIKKLLYQQKQNRSIIFLEKYKYLRQNIIDTAKSAYLNDIYKYGNKFSIINETIHEKRGARNKAKKKIILYFRC